jgi:hypothetical protein
VEVAVVPCEGEPDRVSIRLLSVLLLLEEESRMHVHVLSPDGEAKFWLEPDIELAVAKGLSSHALSEIRDIIEQRREEIRHAWHRHFSD